MQGEIDDLRTRLDNLNVKDSLLDTSQALLTMVTSLQKDIADLKNNGISSSQQPGATGGKAGQTIPPTTHQTLGTGAQGGDQ